MMIKPIDRGFALYPDELQIREEMLREFAVLSPKPDFLFVDYLFGKNDFDFLTGQGTTFGTTALIYNSDTNDKTDIIYFGKAADDGSGYAIWQYDVAPLNIILIAPETFQRYIWNGTSFEVYNDVDEVVPKWLEWKGKVSDVDNADALICVPLNKDEKNYIGDINFIFTEGIYQGANNKLTAKLGMISKIPNLTDDDGILCTSILDGVAIINNGGKLQAGYSDYAVEIKQRLRGAPPKLISAETNVVGDKVILTFDKKMNGYNLANNSFIFSANGQGGGNNIIINPINDTQLIFDCELLENTDIIYIGLSIENVIESLDLGLLQPFTDFPVTNNVPTPLQLVDAYTNTAGTEITFEFDENITDSYLSNIESQHSWSIQAEAWYGAGDIHAITMTVLDNTLTLSNFDIIGGASPLTHTDVITSNFNPNLPSTIFSVTGRMLPPFTGVSITNNII